MNALEACSLRGQVALVTGASSGIGEAVARRLARAGARVVVNYHGHAAGAARVVAAIEAEGGQARAVRADVADEAEVLALFSRTLEAYGRLDVLVANAGIQQDAPVESMRLQDWQRVIDVNLTGQFLCAREAVKCFLRQAATPAGTAAASTPPAAGEATHGAGRAEDAAPARRRAIGKIVCMSSVHEVIPWAGHVNYAASKAGVLLMMKTLAQELAPRRIRVNGVAPGAIRTDINQSAWSDPEALRRLLKLIPYGRIGEPQDVAEAVLWLASEASDYVTGATLYVDGGMTLYPAFRDNG